MRPTLLLWGILVGAPAIAQAPPPRAPAPLELASGAEESTYFRWAAELAARVEEPRLLVQPTNGSADNLRQLVAGRVDLALAQGDAAWHAWAGSGRLPADPELVALGRAFPEMVHLVVRADSGIETVSDLAGRRVDVGAAGSGSVYNALDVLTAAGVVDAVLEYRAALRLERLRSGAVDAVFLTTRPPLADLVLETPDLRVVPLAEETAAALSEAPYYATRPLPETYGEGRSVWVDALVVAHRELPDPVVEAILDGVPLDVEGVTIPLHPRAAAVLLEAAVPDPRGDFVPPPLPELPVPADAQDLEEEEVRYVEVADVVREAMARNPQLAVARLSSERDDIGARIAESAFLPFLSLGGEVDCFAGDCGWEEQLGVSVFAPTGTAVAASVSNAGSTLAADAEWASAVELSIAQDLLDGLGLDANRAAARRAALDARATRAAERQVAVDLVAGVVARFWSLQAAHARMALRRDQLDLARRHLNRVQVRTELGESDELAVQEAGASLAEAEEALLREEQRLRDTEDRLLDQLQAWFAFRLVPLGDVETQAVERLGSEGTLEERLVIAAERRPDLVRSQLAVTRARVDLAAARNARLPSLAAYGTVGRVSDPDAAFASRFGAAGDAFASGPGYLEAGALFGVPLGRGADPLLFRQARLAVEQRQLQLDDANEAAWREVRTAWRAMDTARKRLEVARRGRALADRKLTLTIEAFRRDEADSFKVLTYQQDFVDARLAVLEAAADYLQALAELDRVSGIGPEAWDAEGG